MHIEKKIKQKLFHKYKNIRLDKFLTILLYKENGYYLNQKPIGSKNDFITAPEISQMFGEIIGLYLYYFWKTKINAKFKLIELGPGKLTLFKDIARILSNFPNFFESSKIKFLEINKNLIKLQKQEVKKIFSYKINWSNNLTFKSNTPLIVYSNEFFDCFPVRQFVYKNSWFEKYISLNDKIDKLYFKDKKVVNKKLLSFLDLYKKKGFLEISFKRNLFYENICRKIKKSGGLFLTIDYGYFQNTKNLTLQAIQNHKFSNILDNIGEKDISSHVNFEDLKNIALKHKLKIEEYCTQRDFLIKYGIIERYKVIFNSSKLNSLRTDLERLIGKDKMGNLFKCIIVSKI